jgi:Tol biopolymer transport system component
MALARSGGSGGAGGRRRSRLTYLNRRTGPSSQSTELVRLSPDDGHSYGLPSISPDGKFVAYISDRSGLQQVWLQ